MKDKNKLKNQNNSQFNNYISISESLHKEAKKSIGFIICFGLFYISITYMLFSILKQTCIFTFYIPDYNIFLYLFLIGLLFYTFFFLPLTTLFDKDLTKLTRIAFILKYVILINTIVIICISYLIFKSYSSYDNSLIYENKILGIQLVKVYWSNVELLHIANIYILSMDIILTDDQIKQIVEKAINPQDLKLKLIELNEQILQEKNQPNPIWNYAPYIAGGVLVIIGCIITYYTYNFNSTVETFKLAQPIVHGVNTILSSEELASIPVLANEFNLSPEVIQDGIMHYKRFTFYEKIVFLLREYPFRRFYDPDFYIISALQTMSIEDAEYLNNRKGSRESIDVVYRWLLTKDVYRIPYVERMLFAAQSYLPSIIQH